ncbi:Hypothetical protein, putative [Bodo saltans]|uniref:MIF4G domain-containing protein n=1 Tax=Bodo saltans TaxID=75058 RepID=A0A0S4KNU8_BODSA|nr:Hypothetical protein, putative [Bodo saltans]|eukprot:CUI14573.1 Hypothetical protein, putative [Bodo saltans]
MLASPLAAARQDTVASTFRPPMTLLRSVPPQSRKTGLTAAAAPWTPQATKSNAVAPSHNGPKPPAPLHSSPPLQPAQHNTVPPPAALGNSPALQPSAIRSRDLPTLTLEASPLSIASSPLLATTPLATSALVITEEAMISGVYTFDMFQSLRHDCAHTPQRVLNWVVQLYRTQPTLKVPPHLVLTVDEPIVDDASGLMSRPTVVRRRPVRQVHHKVMSVLSRVTPQKYPELQKELLTLPLKQTTDTELKEVVRVFFEKAVQEEKFSPLYASLVADICKITDAERSLEKEQRDKLLASRIRIELLTTCQEEFQRPIQLSEDDKVDPITGKALEPQVIDSKRDRLKRRLCGNIKFVGELYKKKLVTERVVSLILDLLVGDFDPQRPTAKEEYVFEVFQTLLKCVGVVCKESNPELLRKNMNAARKILCHPTARIRFLMMDLEDMERRGWVPRERLMTMEERERETMERDRRGYEEIERRARARQVELDEYVLSNAMGHHNASSNSLSTPTSAPHSNSQHQQQQPQRGSSFSATHTSQRPPVLNVLSRAAPEVKHPHGTPTASPAKGGRVFSAATNNPSTVPTPNTPSSIPSSPSLLMTPPPKYQKNPINPDRSPVVHPSANLHSIPHVFSASGLNESVASSSQNGGMGRTSSTNSIGSLSNMVASPLSPNAPPLPLHELTNVLMTQFAANKNVDEVLTTLRNITIPQRVCVLTLWLRRACTTTKLFTERDQICVLFSTIMQLASSRDKAVLSPQDLSTTFLEWIRYDVERGQFSNCPRLFANIGSMILQTYQKGSMPSNIDANAQELTKGVLNGMMFTVLLRELHAHESAQAIPTLVKDAQPIVQQILSFLPDRSLGPKMDVLLAMQNSFRILKFVLYGDGALTRAQTPPTPSLRGSPMNESFGSFDAFSQCLIFPKVAEDVEFALYRRLREAPDGNSWREQAIQMAMSQVGGAGNTGINNPVSRLTQFMKVVGTLLTVLHPKDAHQPLTTSIKSEDLDAVVHSIINKRKNAIEYQCAAVIELMSHFTYSVANITTPATADSPSRTSMSPSMSASTSVMLNSSLAEAAGSWANIETRMTKMMGIFRRWSADHIIQGPAVLELLKSIHEGDCGPHTHADEIVAASQRQPLESIFTLQYNFMVESSWSAVLQMLAAS